MYPAGYGRYIAGPGETLETLASAAGLPVEDLRGANCLALDTEIITGDVVYVPQEVEATPTPDGTDVAWTVIGCENAMLARITSPVQGAIITGTSPIIGTAFAPDFLGYRLELRSDDAVELLIDLVSASWPSVRAAALRALANTDVDTFMSALSGLDADPHWSVRASLAATTRARRRLKR